MDLALWEKCTDFHGHACPGLAIGVRAVLIAQGELGVSFPVEGLRCLAEKNMCGCDGVRCITGCTEENRRFVLKETGCTAFSFCLPDGIGVRVEYIGGSKPEDKEPDKEALIKQILDGDREGQFKTERINEK